MSYVTNLALWLHYFNKLTYLPHPCVFVLNDRKLKLIKFVTNVNNTTIIAINKVKDE